MTMTKIYTVLASCFATLSDLRAYNAAIAAGKTEQEALALGDNGIGCWGDNTAQTVTPMCALPPEIMLTTWGSNDAARRQPVLVTLASDPSRSAVCIVADLDEHIAIPAQANGRDYQTRNGTGIDLNPAALQALGFDPEDAEWEQMVTWGPIEPGASASQPEP